MTETFKVSHLVIKKLRNVLDVSFEFDDHLVKISWENGAGKSTIVDAIFLAIVGKTYIGRGRSAEHLISRNQDKAEIECTLSSTGRTLKIFRTINQSGDVKLDIISSDWSKLQQKDLDELLSEFTIDPLEFTRKSKKEQYEIVKKISGVDTTSIEAQIQEQELKTQGVRAIAKMKSEALKDHGYREPVEEINIVDLADEVGKLHSIISSYEQDEKELITLENNLENYDAEIKELQNKLQSLQAKRAEDQDQWMNKKSSLSHNAQEYNDAKAQREAIAEKSNSMKEINSKAKEYQAYQRLLLERDSSVENLKSHEETLESMRDRRKKMIEWGNMPVKWLSFDESEGVLINWLPIDQLSSAQQIMLACRIATSQSPHMKVIYIKDGSLLDEQSMKDITKLANDEDYQIFIERVGEEVDSIIMRDWESI